MAIDDDSQALQSTGRGFANTMAGITGMGLWAKIGWGVLGFLVLLCLVSMFWLDWLLGAGFAVFCALVVWWVFGVLKKKTDARIERAAKALNLDYRPHPFRYASLSGNYQGLAVKISYESSFGWGLGSALVTGTGLAGFAPLDIRNITVLRVGLGGRQGGKQVIEQGPPAIVAKGDWAHTWLDMVCTDPRMLRKTLDRLADHTREFLERRVQSGG